MTGKYDDMLYLPHHVSKTRARMSAADRGAQFSPFAALVGYDEVIRETARRTCRRVELTDSEKEAINHRLCQLFSRSTPARRCRSATSSRIYGKRAGSMSPPQDPSGRSIHFMAC